MADERVLDVLVDADNVSRTRIQLILDALPARGVRLVVAGSDRAVAQVDWPPYAEVAAAHGWQRADMLLAAAYQPGRHALLLVSGDADFGLLAARHDGPVLVVSEAASYRLRD